MDMTTIALTNEIKSELKEFGNKGESFSEIIKKLVNSAKERQLHDLLMDEENTVLIGDALERARKKWQK